MFQLSLDENKPIYHNSRGPRLTLVAISTSCTLIYSGFCRCLMALLWCSAAGRVFCETQMLSPVSAFSTSPHYQQNPEQFQRECPLWQRTFWSDSARVRSCPGSKAPIPTDSTPCASWAVCTHQAFSPVASRPYTSVPMLVTAGISWADINGGEHQFQYRNTKGAYLHFQQLWHS